MKIVPPVSNLITNISAKLPAHFLSNFINNTNASTTCILKLRAKRFVHKAEQCLIHDSEQKV